jgi:hypothetical protein
MSRCFFHLYKGADVILDKSGVEVSEFNRDILVGIVREVLRGQDLKTSELEGWEVRVVDAAGNDVMTFRLGDLGPEQPTTSP